MKNAKENEITKIYSIGMIEYLSGYDWHKVTAVWNMSSNTGFYKIFDETDNEIRPQFYRDEKNREQPKKSIAPEEMRASDLMVKEYFQTCQHSESTRWNKGILTIYSSGECESDFIWDNEVYLAYWEKNIKSWLSSNFEQVGYKIEDKCIQLGIKWDFDVTVVISFTTGKTNPVLFIAPSKPEMDFKLHLDQLWEYIKGDYATAFEEWSKIRVEDPYKANVVLENEKMYHLMNYGELKDRFQRWNKATFVINKDIVVWNKLTFEDIKFEWIEEIKV